MHIYSVHRKMRADNDHRLWLVGPFPNRDLALHHFNITDAKKADIGTFTYEEPDNLPPSDYLMEEDEGMVGRGNLWSLHPVK
jgi:hypothetical protein